MPRTLIFCLDGTWNGHDDKHATNVRKIFHGLSLENQVPFYFAGPGNEDEHNFFGEMFGGAFGVGANSIRDNAYRALESAYLPGDRIAAFAFSRGATIARMLCGKIAKEGVRDHSPSIDFLGCFDTVAAFLPLGIKPLFHDLHVSPKVKRSCHALALDEDRKTFTPNLMNARDGIEEVWFAGVHSDIGGGFKETGLSDIALDWMVGSARMSGLTFDGSFLELITPDHTEAIHVMDGPMRRESRRIGVMVDDDWADQEPTYHVSVMDRIRNVEGYRPELAA